MGFTISEEQAFQTFRETGMILDNGHYQLPSGLHTRTFVNFNALALSQTSMMFYLARGLAERIQEARIRCDLVFTRSGPVETLGRITAQWLDRDLPHLVTPNDSLFQPTIGLELKGKQVLLVEDVVSSGYTLERLATIVRSWNGNVIERAALWLRDPQFEAIALIRRQLDEYAPDDGCPFCRIGRPLEVVPGQSPYFSRPR